MMEAGPAEGHPGEAGSGVHGAVREGQAVINCVLYSFIG